MALNPNKKYVNSKFGVPIEITNLSDKQRKKVLDLANRSKADGRAAARLGAELRATNIMDKRAAAVNPVVSTDPTNLGINKDTGVIDPKKAIKEVGQEVRDDFDKNFLYGNPDEIDEFGNKKTVTIGADGKPIVTRTPGTSQSGALGIFDQEVAKFSSNGGGREAAQNANYSFITKDYAQKKQEEMEAAKQELSNRGIPLDPSPNALYGKTLQQIDQKYRDLDNQAKQQSIVTGDQTYATSVGALGSLAGTAQSFSQTATPYGAPNSDMAGNLQNLLKTISGADLTNNATKQSLAAQLKQIAAQLELGRGDLAAKNRELDIADRNSVGVAP